MCFSSDPAHLPDAPGIKHHEFPRNAKQQGAYALSMVFSK
jgi:hypothetical protein